MKTFIFKHQLENLRWRIRAATKEAALVELATLVEDPSDFYVIKVQ